MLVAMMLLTCADVAGNFFGHPVLGSEEMVALMAALLIACILPAAHLERSHIGVELLYIKFPRWLKRLNNSILSIICAVFFSMVAYECFTYAKDLKRTGEVSPTLGLPFYNIAYVISAAFLFLAIVVLLEFYRYITEKEYE